MKKKAILAKLRNGTSVIKEKLRTKNTGLARRTTVAIRLSLRARPSSRNVPYRAKAPTQASTTVEARRAENENPTARQNNAPQRIRRKGKRTDESRTRSSPVFRK